MAQAVVAMIHGKSFTLIRLNYSTENATVVAGFSPRSTRWKLTRALARDYIITTTCRGCDDFFSTPLARVSNIDPQGGEQLKLRSQENNGDQDRVHFLRL